MRSKLFDDRNGRGLMAVLLLAYVATFSPPSSAAVSEAECLAFADATRFAVASAEFSRCYVLETSLTTQKSWNAAEAAAQALHPEMHLVSIHSKAENDFIFGIATNLEAWIGFSDQLAEGSFTWSDGSPVDYTNWYPGEPNNSGDEDFVVLNTLNAWNDLGAGENRRSIFAAPLGSPPELLVEAGELVGARAVTIGEALYDVEFLDGRCDELFSGCDAPSDFLFDEQTAALASQALLNSVFVDGAQGSFDSNPELTRGCSDTTVCLAYTPFEGDGVQSVSKAAWNTAPGFGNEVVTNSPFPVTLDTAVGGPGFDATKGVFARWTPHAVNQPPTAQAGQNQAALIGMLVTLDGSGSSDDATPTENLLYDWQFEIVPPTSTAVLVDSNTTTPNFTPDVAGVYQIQLVVTDEEGLASTPSAVEISVAEPNAAPNADAGSDQATYVGALVVLDGSASSDPDSDPLSYEWILADAPVGSTTLLTGADTVSPSFIPDLPGSYAIDLEVTDPPGATDTDEVTIVVIPPEDFAQMKIGVALNAVADLPPADVTTAGNQIALGNFLTQAITQLQKGKTKNAIIKLREAIERTDGCALRGFPDSAGGGKKAPAQDFVTSCETQSETYPPLVDALDTLTP